MFHLLLILVLPEFDHLVAVHTFSTLRQQFQLQDDWSQVLMVQLRTSVCLTSLILCTLSNWENDFFRLFKMLWESANRSPFSSFTSLFLGWCPLLNSFIPLYRSLMFLSLMFVASSFFLSFVHSLYLFLKCCLASRLTLFILLPFISLGCRNHCNLVCFLSSNKFVIKPCLPRLQFIQLKSTWAP
jgi:hypothetical protein